MIYLKNKKQIQGIRKSCHLASECLKFIKPFVIAGITTLELDQKIKEYIVNRGGYPAALNYNGFPKSCCISVNEVVCHGIPSNYTLKDGDILNVDVATNLDGYYGDNGTMFAIGNISTDAEKLIEVTKNALQIGIKQVRPGNFLGNIGYEINRYASSQNCSVVTAFSGHGFGISFHEDPPVVHVGQKNTDIKIRKGMTFTIEPMICLGKSDIVIDADGWTARTQDGSLSAQEEHSLLVTQNGVEILTL